MSVVGFDFGNLSLLIGQTSKGGVDVILNDASNRQTATYISIQGKQRFLGDSAAALARSNINNTISCMKLLVGRDYDCIDVQNEIKKSSFKTRKLPSGGVGIVINYDNKEIVISAEHAMGMMLVKAKETAYKANKNIGVGDAVLAVPFWFSESQRKGILNACEIASLNCLKVANESTLIALSYGIFKSAKKLFSETIPVHVMFIDLSYSGYCVSIVGFIQENMNVLSTVCERSFGGRDFDDVIIEYLADKFQQKTGINVRNNKVALLKLQVAAEKAKKTLSPSGVMEANISVECLSDDNDLSCNLTRVEFESRCSGLVSRLEAPILECLKQAKLGKQDISEIEIVGGTSRVNIIKRKLGEILGVDNTAVNYGMLLLIFIYINLLLIIIL
jgi:molecular chaperone DnaK (HSP70)